VLNLGTGGNYVNVYAPGSYATPSATIAGSSTGLNGTGVAVDSKGNIYVSNAGNINCDLGPYSVTVYPAGSNGNVTPSATITGSNTGLSCPMGIAVDSSGNIYVANWLADVWGSITVYPAGSNGNVAPTATISGGNTDLDAPWGIAVDSSRNIYEVNMPPSNVYVYPAGSNGDVASSAFFGSFLYPVGIAVGSNGKIYVADGGNAYNWPDTGASVYVYPAGSNSYTAPIATITGSKTGLTGLEGIAVDSSGYIYVGDDGNPDAEIPPSVLVYSPGSNGNVAPIATITDSDCIALAILP
jgi:sugar lactone lactonase YvrE